MKINPMVNYQNTNFSGKIIPPGVGVLCHFEDYVKSLSQKEYLQMQSILDSIERHPSNIKINERCDHGQHLWVAIDEQSQELIHIVKRMFGRKNPIESEILNFLIGISEQLNQFKKTIR